MKKLFNSQRISSFFARFNFLPRWLLLTLGITSLFYLVGFFASPNLPTESKGDTRSRLLSDYSPWANTLFIPVSNLIFEAISAETGRQADPDAIADIEDRSSLWQGALPAGEEPEFVPTSTPTDIPPTITPIPPSPTHTSTSTSTPQPTLTPSQIASPTNTRPPRATKTPTSPPANTNTPTETLTPSNTPTNTPTSTPTFTPSPTSSCIAGTINRTAFQDSFTESGNPDNNNDGHQDAHIEAANVDHGLYQFDISDIPTDCVVSSGRLSIVQTVSKDITAEVRRLTGAWAEGTVTWNNEPGNDSVAWATFNGVSSTPLRREFDITPLVQGWVDLTYTNYGVVIIGTVGNDEIQFATLDDGSKDPILVVDYGP